MALHARSRLDLFPGLAQPPLASRETFALGGRLVEYTLKRSLRRRSITFTIDENGLRVGAPWRASQRRIEALLATHRAWIERKLAEWQARRPPPFEWRSGATVMLRGTPLTLVHDTALAGTRCDDGRLLVGTASAESTAMARQVVAWLRAAALEWFAARAAHFAAVLDVRIPEIRLSNARTRWGSCHSDGRVYLNWRLIQMPHEIIDYVVVHELSHLREPNHSPRFWGWVAGVLPDYRDRRRSLRRDGYRYLIA